MLIKSMTKILTPFVLLYCSTSVFADSTFNQNLEQFVECKKTLNDYYNLGFEFEDDLKKNGWIKQGEEYTYNSKTPITVFGQQTQQITLTTGGILAVLTKVKTEDLAKKYQIKRHSFFQNTPYFSGEKIVKTDQETQQVEKSVRKLTLAESNPLVEEGEHKTYIGCVYITEFEQKQQEEAMKAL